MFFGFKLCTAEAVVPKDLWGLGLFFGVMTLVVLLVLKKLYFAWLKLWVWVGFFLEISWIWGLILSKMSYIL